MEIQHQEVNIEEIPIEKSKNSKNEKNTIQIETVQNLIQQQEENIEKIEIQSMEVQKREKMKDSLTLAINAVNEVEEINVISMFCKPKINQIRTFFSFHPIQPHNTLHKRLPFNENIFLVIKEFN